MLIVLSGLPGAGKTSIARELALRTNAVHIRIDSIEQAIRESGALQGGMDDAGYRAAYRLAARHLRLGCTVIADSVNPLPLTRDAWAAVGRDAGARVVEVEVVCSDAAEHRRRVETRVSDIAGLLLPDWPQVLAREYHPWTRPRLVVDTAGRTIAETVALLCESLYSRNA